MKRKELSPDDGRVEVQSNDYLSLSKVPALTLVSVKYPRGIIQSKLNCTTVALSITFCGSIYNNAISNYHKRKQYCKQYEVNPLSTKVEALLTQDEPYRLKSGCGAVSGLEAISPPLLICRGFNEVQ